MAKFPGLRPIGGNVENVIIGRSTLWDPSDYGHLENIIFIKSSYITINQRWGFCRIITSASVEECQQYDIKTVHCFWDTNLNWKLIIQHCTTSEKVIVKNCHLDSSLAWEILSWVAPNDDYYDDNSDHDHDHADHLA